MDTVKKCAVAMIITCPICKKRHKYFWSSTSLRENRGGYKSYRYCELESRGLIEQEAD